ncbi:MAG: alcohol dehydrogenase [Acidobacteria bacterium]|nr:MAG: alcohol dehydrogenase [Acidobacteriota bacterium]
MKAAVITKPGRTPLFADFDDPVPQVDEELVAVTASALSHVTKSRASGSHHTSPGSLPAVVGIDGVGRTQDGRRVYFVLPEEPFGGMAEKVAVRRDQCIPLPADVDDITAAAIAIPGMSSWAAFKERAHLIAGENVLINGATGTSGRLAVQIAKYMGAKRVIATGRNVEALEQLMGIGADATVPLTRSPKELETAFKEQFGGEGVDVVLDYLWGQSAETLIMAAAKAGKDAVPIRFVQIGALSGGNIALSSAALRSSALVLMGSGIGSIPLKGLVSAISGVRQAVVPGKLKIETKVVPLTDVEDTWNKGSGTSRVVFVVRQNLEASASF